MDSLPFAFGRIPAKREDNESKMTVEKSRTSKGVAQMLPASFKHSKDEGTFTEKGRSAHEGVHSEAAQAQTLPNLPVTHSIILKDHSKTVSALSLDPAGARLVSGSYDYDVKLWDFAGMNAELKPFRSYESTENHQVHDVQFSTSGDSFLVASGSNQPKLYDRDGIELATFNKGDMYIRDLRHTDGHTASLSAIAWRPNKSSEFMSASADSTIRIWEVQNRRKSLAIVVVKSKDRGGKTKVSACAWSSDGRLLVGACEDGAMHIWSANSNFARPTASLDRAHTKGTVTSGVVFSEDSRQLASRGGDGTVKLWDVRSLRNPIHVATDLPSLNPETNLIYSPDGRYLLTGTSGSQAGVLAGKADEERLHEAALQGATNGAVVVLDINGLNVERRIAVSESSAVRILWHPKINQIIVGSSDGRIHVLYSPLTSTKGATLAVNRVSHRKDSISMIETSVYRPIIAPHSLPMFKDDMEGSAGGSGGKRKRMRERHDPQKTMKPMPPITGAGHGGRIGAAATQHVVQGLVRDNMRDQDPREALLKYAAEPGDNNWTSAWDKTQPRPVFDTRPEESE